MVQLSVVMTFTYVINQTQLIPVILNIVIVTRMQTTLITTSNHGQSSKVVQQINISRLSNTRFTR
jgi:hypothetical protein